jgi:hypothetical protein
LKDRYLSTGVRKKLKGRLPDHRKVIGDNYERLCLRGTNIHAPIAAVKAATSRLTISFLRLVGDMQP